ncbi:hypothetical protein CHS0354_004487 [Potamilus streckersoni]|uniref:Uncharacterized protein n=1 Tax=Potamilus streckersoni TaxID=2493646 RepID=A0AAE0SNY7_9BIVA|nr:hypothetical protein CHS0354_004487 [Potamilus streckersoni]
MEFDTMTLAIVAETQTSAVWSADAMTLAIVAEIQTSDVWSADDMTLAIVAKTHTSAVWSVDAVLDENCKLKDECGFGTSNILRAEDNVRYKRPTVRFGLWRSFSFPSWLVRAKRSLLMRGRLGVDRPLQQMVSEFAMMTLYEQMLEENTKALLTGRPPKDWKQVLCYHIAYLEAPTLTQGRNLLLN